MLDILIFYLVVFKYFSIFLKNLFKKSSIYFSYLTFLQDFLIVSHFLLMTAFQFDKLLF